MVALLSVGLVTLFKNYIGCFNILMNYLGFLEVPFDVRNIFGAV